MCNYTSNWVMIYCCYYSVIIVSLLCWLSLDWSNNAPQTDTPLKTDLQTKTSFQDYNT